MENEAHGNAHRERVKTGRKGKPEKGSAANNEKKKT